ncbi:protein mono-ADP-ribosyltransferase PARP12-like isoform X2 [Limanda limanda]|uniref:protein mono-ADP-ribosyltransferase PARP12-like isoform X2 n=1 Tax=Limanda limanda TaxID=27771 RepID=UPI0029C8543A|nr:protein mono-ADP-ribosyltransferase PARP12-like isoform X2 [Limanda limanda]
MATAGTPEDEHPHDYGYLSPRGSDSDEDDDSQVTAKEPCRYYNKGHCRDGDTCRHPHVCKFALSGNCRYGSGCKLKHPRGGASEDEDPPEAGYLSPRGRNSDGDDDSQVTAKEPCRYYNKGHCRDGDTCTHPHVCKFALSGNCRYGSGCKLKHPRGGRRSSQAGGEDDPKISGGRLYKWQLNDGTGWMDFSNDHVIEAQYCLPHTKSIKLYNTTHGVVNINFNLMTVSGKSLRVRRLDDGNTEWVWFCTLYSKWIKYGDKDPDGKPTPANSSDIEQKFQSNPKSSFTFNIGAKTYEIKFVEMQQVSKDRKRRVTRRPLYRQRRAGAGVPRGHSVSQNTAVGTKPQWQFEGDNRVWHNFKNTRGTNETSDDIERKFQDDPNKIMDFQANGNTYNLDFGAMIQTNLKTMFTRRIRRRLV